jgi:hypothetical protein
MTADTAHSVDTQTVESAGLNEGTSSTVVGGPSTEGVSPATIAQEDTPFTTPQTERDPNAYRITILLASSGYRTHISVNRSLLEKASLNDCDGFLVSQLKNALWKDWPAGGPPARIGLT